MSTFDEQGYLEANPDVADAVTAGKFTCGLNHYEIFGRSEERPLNPDQTRKGKMLAGLDIARLSGVEIGPLAAPLVKKVEGDIYYVDHAPTDEIVQKYASDPTILRQNIVDIDAVWGACTLQQCLNCREGSFDYVLASHVVEHVPDLITWLAEVKDIMKPSGTLRLAVPDKRYEFDYLRKESVLADMIDAYLRRARAPLPRMIVDFYSFQKEISVHDAWNGKKVDQLNWSIGCQQGMSLARAALSDGSYHDVHCWVFTPKSFALLMAQCAELGLVKFRCEVFHDTPRFQLEFIVGLKQSDDRMECVESWCLMAAQAKG